MEVVGLNYIVVCVGGGGVIDTLLDAVAALDVSGKCLSRRFKDCLEPP